MKLRHLLVVFLLISTACNSPVASATKAIEDTPTPAPYPDTPSPPQLDAPIVESPSLVTIQFVNSLDGWGVTETQVVRTNDGGSSWYNVTPPDLTETGYTVEMSILDVNNVWIQIPDFENYYHNGFLYHTSDGGMTWTNHNTPFSGSDIRFLDTNNGWALADLGVATGSNAVAVYQTTDGGMSWTQKYTNDPNNPIAGDSLPLGGLKAGLAPLNMQTAWVYGVTYSSGTIYLFRTDDGGANWSPVQLPLPPGVENYELGIEPGQIQFVSPNTGFIAVRFTGDGYQLAIYVTQDAGNTWTLTPTLIPESGIVDFLSAEEMVVFTGRQFYVTRDAARTWSVIPPDIGFGESFAMMDFVHTSTGYVLTTDPATGQHSLYRSGDGGATWFPIVP